MSTRWSLLSSPLPHHHHMEKLSADIQKIRVHTP
jgi:hypothetical protein